MKKSKLLLIDSSALIYRAFYALPPLTDKQGRVVNAVYGFMSAFINILKQTEPTHVIFAFDSPKPTKRAEIYVEYKAHRDKAPDDLYSQIPISKEMVKNLGFTELEEAGFEADDIIATCAKIFIEENPEGEVVIATGDMDTLQLINDKIKVFTLSRGITESKIYDASAVKERYGLDPKQMNDYKALFGDPSDNIKGVKGIGKKTATELLQKYIDLEGVYKNLGLLKPRLAELLTQEKEQAFLSRQLVTLEKEVPCECDLDKTSFSAIELASKSQFFSDMSFDTLARRVENLANGGSKGKVESQSKPAPQPETRQLVTSINRIEDKDSLEKLISVIHKHPNFIVWSGEKYKNKGLILASLQDNQLAKIYSVANDLVPQLENLLPKECKGVGFDLKELGKNIFPIARIFKKSSDLKLKAYLVQPPLMRKFGFKEVLWHFLKERWEEPKKQMNLLEQIENGYSQEKIAELAYLLAKLTPEIETAFAEQVTYQEQSTFIPQIFPNFENRIKERSIEYIYKKIEKPLSNVLGQMELAGVKVNLELIEDLRHKNARSIENLKRTIFEHCGREFNLDSPSQLADILFNELRISSEESKRGKSGHFSTAAGVLEKLVEKHPVISCLLDYREQRKFQTTYLEVIPKLINRETGRLHTTFEQTGAATGRLSSNNPNLQNIPLQPINDNVGVRHAFVAEKGFKLISLDYSQIEIRLAAYLTGEEKLIKAFERGDDIHQQTAAFVNQIEPEEVTKNLRNAAKALNFGIIYGMSPFGFSQSAKMPEAEARAFIHNYFQEFPQIAKYLENTKQFARDHGFVETIFGRRRYVPEVNLDNRILRQAGERMAINMPLQGTAADIMKLSLVAVNKFLEEKYVDSKTHPLERDVRILLSIHDEIILEVKENLVDKVAEEVRKIMENVISDIIPLKVDMDIGENWGEI